MKKSFIGIIFVLMGLTISGCGVVSNQSDSQIPNQLEDQAQVVNDNSSAPIEITPANTAAASDSAPTKKTIISNIGISNFSFNPSNITIPAGSKVIWLNNDSASHTVVGDSGFSSGVLTNGGSFIYTFDNPGIYTYHCSLHPSMKGQIIVK